MGHPSRLEGNQGCLRIELQQSNHAEIRQEISHADLSHEQQADGVKVYDA